MTDKIIGHLRFSDGTVREVHFDGRRQFIIVEPATRLYGLWLSRDQLAAANEPSRSQEPMPDAKG